MNARVREATPDDASSVACLVGYLRALEGLAEPLDPDAVRDYLARPDTRVFLAEQGDDVVGCISVRVAPDLFHGRLSAEVEELVVEESHRQSGVGGALLDAAIERALSAGCVEIGLSTGANNEPAQRLYASRGLTVDGVYMERHFK